jgi:hypothetical protein
MQGWRKLQELRVPPTKRKRTRCGVSTGSPTRATHRGHVWTWDFIADATVRGGALRMLTILDEHTRECHVLRADRALKSRDVLDWLARNHPGTRGARIPAERQRPRVHRPGRAAMAQVTGPTKLLRVE